MSNIKTSNIKTSATYTIKPLEWNGDSASVPFLGRFRVSDESLLGVRKLLGQKMFYAEAGYVFDTPRWKSENFSTFGEAKLAAENYYIECAEKLLEISQWPQNK